MRRDFAIQKQGILAVLLLLIVGDVVLAVYSYRVANAPRSTQSIYNDQVLQEKLWQKDIDNAQSIKDRIPAIQKDCDQFERSLRPSSQGYSELSAEIDEIAKKAGLHIDGMGFKQKQINGRNVDEVAIEATVSGEYANVVKFINGLQRSQSMYSVTALTLASDTSAQGASSALRVALHLKTYFRNA